MLTSLFFAAQVATAEPPVTPQILDVEVVRSYPHETDAFTQGLLFADGVLIESTGLEGASRLRKLSIKTGKPIQEIHLPSDVFGEGTARVGDKLVTLTYKAGQGFVWDLETFKQVGSFTYTGEGWGLTFDGEKLIMSDGSEELRFLDPETFKETGRVTVTLSGQPLRLINELEYVDGKVWANVFVQDFLVRIDPDTGIIDAVADLRGLYPRDQRKEPMRDVLNGIAYEEQTGRLFVTGKNWPQLFEVTLQPRQEQE